MKTKKIGLFIPDGVGVKNYLYSSVFSNNEDEVILFHNFNEETIANISQHVKINHQVKTPNYKEQYLEKFYRELIHLCRLKHNVVLTKNKTILSNWNPKKSKWSLFLFYSVIEFISLFAFSYKHILFLEKIYQKIIRNNKNYNQFINFLTEFKCEKIFCTHQRAIEAPAFFAAAMDLNIKTVSVIFSWDNLPKARLALQANEYFVWSDYMKEEMNTYYPEIDSNRVIVTGTPQFEFYSDKNNIIDKVGFYKKYNLDLYKKIICFSGDDEKTSPDDPKYLADIAEKITKENLTNEFQIIFRRCPVDLSKRFDEVISAYPNLIKIIEPLWSNNSSDNWSAVYPIKQDVNLLVSTCFYSDLVINVGSTMAFDFAMFNKPCVFINYDQEFQNDKNWSINTIYNFQHFHSMENKKAVVWLNNKEEIIKKIRLSLNKKNNSEMLQWKETVIGDYLMASKNIKKQLNLS